MRGRWSDSLERQLLSFEARGPKWHPSDWEFGILSALRHAAPDHLVERRVDVLRERGVKAS